MGIADASNAVLAARHRTHDIATLDRRRFGVPRTLDGARFAILP